jgi:hypothetical protein
VRSGTSLPSLRRPTSSPASPTSVGTVTLQADRQNSLAWLERFELAQIRVG